MAFKQLDLLLGELQSDSNTEMTGLLAEHILQVADGFSLDLTQEKTAMAFATGEFDQHPVVPGAISADAKIKTYLAANASAGPDSFAPYLACSGMPCSGTTRRTYAPSSNYSTDWKRHTLWKYTGETAGTGSYLTKAFGVMYNGVIKGELGKPVSLELTGKGAVSAFPDKTAYPTGPFSAFSDVNPPPLNYASFAILDDPANSYRLLSFEIDFGNKLELIKDMTKPFGFVRCDITEIKSKWKAKIYEAAYIGSNPFSLMNSAEAFAFTVKLFQANSIEIGTSASSPNSAILTAQPKAGNENGINTWDLEGIFLHNNWSLVVNA